MQFLLNWFFCDFHIRSHHRCKSARPSIHTIFNVLSPCPKRNHWGCVKRWATIFVCSLSLAQTTINLATNRIYMLFHNFTQLSVTIISGHPEADSWNSASVQHPLIVIPSTILRNQSLYSSTYTSNWTQSPLVLPLTNKCSLFLLLKLQTAPSSHPDNRIYATDDLINHILQVIYPRGSVGTDHGTYDAGTAYSP